MEHVDFVLQQYYTPARCFLRILWDLREYSRSFRDISGFRILRNFSSQEYKNDKRYLGDFEEEKKQPLENHFKLISHKISFTTFRILQDFSAYFSGNFRLF